jgi:hypothetical protein
MPEPAGDLGGRPRLVGDTALQRVRGVRLPGRHRAGGVRERRARRGAADAALNPVVALEMLAAGTWSGAGVLGPEAFDAVPFLDLLAGDYASPWGFTELSESS